ncbi:hypothetical protein SRB5_62270 [Streptomyces sp. RB5]|uniref:DUF6801 domain-containing protein n=1 Tax=Streptomyces smaragdinus TaxID=2585196 RepID=A0A7K0CRB5_9ACTN|nr:DUF6801 domain-containing protein [Streptomyces smaragdinus]MQY16035.1 hypothetical protein [Streptomyces smaragdinus]
MDRRRTTRVASVGAIALLCGLLPLAESAAQERRAETSAAYSCAFPSGPQDVSAVVTADFPTTGAVDKPMQPRNISVAVSLPSDLLSALPGGDAPGLTAAAELKVQVEQGKQTAVAPWAGLTAKPVSQADEKTTLLEFTGEVPTVTVTSPGTVGFSAGHLDLVLTPGAVEGGAEASSIACDLAPLESGLLAAVTVPGEVVDEDAPSDAPKSPTAQPQDDQKRTQDDAAGPGITATADPVTIQPCPTDRPTIDWDPSFFPPPIPGNVISDNPLGGVYQCAYILGIANAAKLGSATMLNNPAGVVPAQILSNVQFSGREQRGKAQLNLPDSTSTNLTFGFMPVTATVEFNVGPTTFYARDEKSSGVPTYIRMRMNQTMRIKDVRINGVVYDVGNECRSGPMRVDVTGFDSNRDPEPPEYTVFQGGTLRSSVTIPPFSGCAHGSEDLNDLLTATLSGPGNYIELRQGWLCIPATCFILPQVKPTLPQ